MNETTEIQLTNKQVMADQVVVTVLSGIAGLAASKLVEKTYKFAVTAYRVKKASA